MSFNKSILDKSFKYISSSKTDIRKTFARIKREQEEAKKVAVIPKVRYIK